MESSRIMDLFAYYLSEYDAAAFDALGFDTQSRGFEFIAGLYNMKPSYLRRLRDEYDVVTSSTRNGQRNRPPRKRILETAASLKAFSFLDLTEIVKSFIENADGPVEIDITEKEGTVPEETPEDLLEAIVNAKDPGASIRIQNQANKVRVYNTAIIKQLKKLYKGQCQLCGCRPFEDHNEDICEAHHIDYFSSSKNNDAANLIVLCPNHHRLIHKADPSFDRETCCFVFPDGTKEIVKLNRHL